jgi:HopA1 effector protein family
VSRYREQVAAALEAVTIRGPTRYAWLGRGNRPLPVSIDAELDESARRSYLLSCLREELYWSFYCHGRPVPARWGEPEPVAGDPWLVDAMSQANTGRGSWEPGWRVQRLRGEEAVVATPRIRARVPVENCRAPSGEVRLGAAVSVRLPKELPELSPGFYTVVSDALDPPSSAGVVRVYWNVTRAGAPALVRAMTSRLNGEGAPFRLKVADHAVRLQRCDAAVLYIRGDVFSALRLTLREVATELAAHLQAAIPAFTLEFAPGVGLAEVDGDGQSFGLRRCSLLADGIVRTYSEGIRQIDAQLDAVAERFGEEGVRLDAPYLEPSLADCHVL